MHVPRLLNLPSIPPLPAQLAPLTTLPLSVPQVSRPLASRPLSSSTTITITRALPILIFSSVTPSRYTPALYFVQSHELNSFLNYILHLHSRHSPSIPFTTITFLFLYTLSAASPVTTTDPSTPTPPLSPVLPCSSARHLLITSYHHTPIHNFT